MGVLSLWAEMRFWMPGGSEFWVGVDGKTRASLVEVSSAVLSACWSCCFRRTSHNSIILGKVILTHDVVIRDAVLTLRLLF